MLSLSKYSSEYPHSLHTYLSNYADDRADWPIIIDLPDPAGIFNQEQLLSYLIHTLDKFYYFSSSPSYSAHTHLWRYLIYIQNLSHYKFGKGI